MRLPTLAQFRADTNLFASTLNRADLSEAERFYLAGCGFAFFGQGPAEANFQAWANHMLAVPPPVWPASSVMPVAGYRRGVDPWERFLVANPDEAGGDAAPQKMTAQRWQDLVAVNAAANQRIAYQRDAAGTDEWVKFSSADAAPRGDCDEYAIEKRTQLIARGWNRGALRMMFTRKFQALTLPEYHVVLLARTTAGDYVLDNASATVKPWSAAMYPTQGMEPGHVYEWLEPYPGTDAFRNRHWHRCDTGFDELRFWPTEIRV